MKLMNAVRSLFSPVPDSSGGSKRGFNAGKRGRLSSDFGASFIPGNEDIKKSNQVMKAKARDLFKNNSHIKKYASIMEHNVIGHNGLRLQALSKDGVSLDVKANETIEAAWAIFCKRKNVDVRKINSMREIQALALKTLLIDGECFIRMVSGFKGNKFRFALQFIDTGYISELINDVNQNIKMGIKYDEWDAPIGYCVTVKDRNASTYTYNGGHYTIIPAEEMIHLFLPQFVDQGRGFTSLHSVMEDIHQVGEYRGTELVAARAGAGKMGFFTTPDGEAPINDGDDIDNPIMEADPGTIHTLPEGTTFQEWDPKHPGGNYSPFIKTCLQAISSGLEVSYVALANDLESVSYSSIRTGTLSDRDVFKRLQSFIAERLLTEVYDAWLPLAMLSNQIALPIGKIDKFLSHKWQPRGWDWVDPLKDIQASRLAIDAKLTTRREVIESQGGDWEETWHQLGEEDKLAKTIGLDLYPELTQTIIKASKEAEKQLATEEA